MNKICRICLEEGVLSSIFARNFNLSWCDMIEYCFNVKISKNDGLPEQLCSNCVYKLGITYHFKQTCESADIRLRQYLGLSLPNKSNDAAVMTDPVPVVRQTVIKNCKCQSVHNRKSSSNYKRKAETEKQKRGPKPKPKQIHSCFQCDKEFRCQAQLDMHVRTHTGDRPFGCMYCSRRFTQKHNLTIHLRIHTGEKPFQCDICSKRFSAQGNLQTHLKIHTGQRDHTCTLCSKSFITSSELTRHMCKHRGVKDYKCDICGFAFVQSRDLKQHKLKKHQIDVSSKSEKKDFLNHHIDIIGVDTGKDMTTLSKENKVHVPTTNSLKEPEVNPNQSLLIGDQKGVKDEFNQYVGQEKHSCTICGEQFDFLTRLAQHYLHRHKGYEPIHSRGFNLAL